MGEWKTQYTQSPAWLLIAKQVQYSKKEQTEEETRREMRKENLANKKSADRMNHFCLCLCANQMKRKANDYCYLKKRIHTGAQRRYEQRHREKTTSTSQVIAFSWNCSSLINQLTRALNIRNRCYTHCIYSDENSGRKGRKREEDTRFIVECQDFMKSTLGLFSDSFNTKNEINEAATGQLDAQRIDGGFR